MMEKMRKTTKSALNWKVSYVAPRSLKRDWQYVPHDHGHGKGGFGLLAKALVFHGNGCAASSCEEPRDLGWVFRIAVVRSRLVGD